VLGILEMRRHYSNYLKGIPHIKEVRNQLVQKNSLEEIEIVLSRLNAERLTVNAKRLTPSLLTVDG
jgi:tRNA-dihydrouridine synthase